MGTINVNKMLRNIILALGIFAIIVLIGSRTNSFMFVRGTSMYPTLHNGSMVIINTLDRDYKVGDILVFHKDDEIYVKRVIYTGYNYYYFIKPNSDGNSYSIVYQYHNKSAANLAKQYSLKSLEDKFWMKGDGYCSINSETYGPISKEKVIGKVVFHT
jgi:signal peptidase I